MRLTAVSGTDLTLFIAMSTELNSRTEPTDIGHFVGKNSSGGLDEADPTEQAMFKA